MKLKKQLYSCEYNGEEKRIYARCEEEAYWLFLKRMGIEPNNKWQVEDIVSSYKIRINLA